MSRVSQQNAAFHALLLSPSSFAEASLHDPFLLQRFGHRCPFISSKAKAGRVLAGGLRCPSSSHGLDAVGAGLPFPGVGRQAEDQLEMWTRNRGHMGCRLQQVKIDFSSTACMEATWAVICHPGASLTHAFLSVLLQK